MTLQILAFSKTYFIIMQFNSVNHVILFNVIMLELNLLVLETFSS